MKHWKLRGWHQVWEGDFDPWNPWDRGRELPPSQKLFLWSPHVNCGQDVCAHVQEHVCADMDTHTHLHTVGDIVSGKI